VSQAQQAPTFVLLHSAGVGPSTWAPVAGALRARGHTVEVPSMLGFADAGPSYSRAYINRATAVLGSLALDAPVLLVGHSNAGLFLPAIARVLAPRVVALIYADASIPPVERRDVAIAPETFLDDLRVMAVDGILPRWGDWWPDDVTAGLYPDPATRQHVAAEEPQLPLAFFEERVTVPEGWARRPCGYLRFSEGYEPDAGTAARLGWPVRRLSGEHLHMLIDPTGVAAELSVLAATLNKATTSQEP
jgi:pimeloyl-ACP methyl ester carboxylesterase